MVAITSQRIFRLRHFLIGAIFFLLWFLSSAPAWLIAWGLQKTQYNQIVIHNPEGSFWNGKASTLQIALPSNPPAPAHAVAKLALKNLQWSWQPSRLFNGEIAWKISLDDPQATANAMVGLGFSSVALRNAKVDIASPLLLQALQPNFPELELLKPTGTLTLAAEQFDIKQNQFNGKAQLEWRNAALAMSPVNPLGHYRADISASGTAAEFIVSTLSGPLKITGKGSAALKDGLKFSGSAQADPAQAANIEPLLNLMGRPAVNGVYPLDLPPK